MLDRRNLQKSPKTLEECDPVAARLVHKDLIYEDLFQLCHLLGYSDVDPVVHAEIIKGLTIHSFRKLICVPRGTFKSSIGSIAYPIWRLIRDPNLRILIDSEIFGNSVAYLRAIQEHLRSESMSHLFGSFEHKDTIWRQDEFTIAQRTKKGLKEPSISAGGVGTRRIGMHYDLIIGDDYNSPQNCMNTDQAQKVIDHYRYNLSILEPDGEYVIIGTRYGPLDLIGWLLREVIDEPELAEGRLI